ncbi:MAG: M48 family metalloprotease, partial [Gammaproteobacteria bacterium]|nr:M48 family metalloprotease [Gammaproteobacteria bacterium]
MITKFLHKLLVFISLVYLPCFGQPVSQNDREIAWASTEDIIQSKLILATLHKQPAKVEDFFIRAYLVNLLNTLTQATDFQTGELFVWHDKTINAMALPGGHILVNLGLVVATQNTDELASVIAHELAHIGLRHLDQWNTQQKRTNLSSLAAVLLAGVLASKSGQSGSALLSGTQAL